MQELTLVDVVILDVSGETRRACYGLAMMLRARGYNVDQLYEVSMRRAVRYLDRSGCHVGVVIGEREMREGVVRVIETFSVGWHQYDVPVAELSNHLLFH